MKTLFVKIVIICLVFAMIYNLFKALMVMNKRPRDQNGDGENSASSSDAKGSENMSKYIGRRVMFSALIIIFLLISVATGLIELNPSPLLK